MRSGKIYVCQSMYVPMELQIYSYILWTPMLLILHQAKVGSEYNIRRRNQREEDESISYIKLNAIVLISITCLRRTTVAVATNGSSALASQAKLAVGNAVLLKGSFSRKSKTDLVSHLGAKNLVIGKIKHGFGALG